MLAEKHVKGHCFHVHRLWPRPVKWEKPRNLGYLRKSRHSWAQNLGSLQKYMWRCILFISTGPVLATSSQAREAQKFRIPTEHSIFLSSEMGILAQMHVKVHPFDVHRPWPVKREKPTNVGYLRKTRHFWAQKLRYLQKYIWKCFVFMSTGPDHAQSSGRSPEIWDTCGNSAFLSSEIGILAKMFVKVHSFHVHRPWPRPVKREKPRNLGYLRKTRPFWTQKLGYLQKYM